MNGNIEDFKSLKQRLAHYKPNLRSLRYQIGQEIEKPTGNLDFLLIESTAVILFNTQVGLSILNELYNIDNGQSPDSVPKGRSIQYLHTKWDKTTLLRFYQFCLSNDLLIFDMQWYTNSLHKQNIFNIIMGPNYDDSIILSSLSCDSNYNILLDLLSFFKHDIETILTHLTAHYLIEDKWYDITKTPQSHEQCQNILTFILKQYGRMFTTYDLFINFDVQLKQDLPKPTLLSKFQLIDKYLKNIVDSDIWYSLLSNKNSTTTAIDYFRETAAEEEHYKEYFLILKKRYQLQQKNQSHGQQSHTINTPLNDKNSNTMIDINWQSNLRYNILSSILDLKSFQDLSCTSLQFETLCVLTDPLTQPLPNDNFVVSIDFLSNIFIHHCFEDLREGKIRSQGYDIKFHISINMERIILNSMERLNCWNYHDLQNLGLNDFDNKDVKHWWDMMYTWLPRGLNTQDLELLYMVNIMAVYVIYKLYEDKPIQLNPYLSTLISVWKKLSCVILFSLDMDRMLEQDETRETPLLVRATIRGASALRSVIATILNGHVDYMEHDFKHEPINTFMSPHGRKLCQGALHADLRSHAAAMLALGVDLKDVTDLLADLQAGDRFDEDIRYMFEYEYEDYNVVDDEQADGRPNEAANNQNLGGLFQHRRCNCIFDDDKMVSVQMQNGQDNMATNSTNTTMAATATYNNNNGNVATSSTNTPFAIRSKAFFEFDYSGKDWRDIPRGLNLYYTPTYKFVKNPKLEDVNKLMVRATTTLFDKSESELLLRLVASCVKEEQESMILNRFTENGKDSASQQGENKAKIVTPDDIYEIWCDNNAFEKMVYVNIELAWKLMDEMLMCNGYRRVLIWFLTHMELNHTLIHYIFELVMGLRGQEFDPNSSLEDKKKNLLHDLLVTKRGDDDEHNGNEDNTNNDESKDKLPFSRQGPLILSEIETNMLLQEFFTNAAIYLSSSNPDNDQADSANGTPRNDSEEDPSNHVSLYTIGLVKLICFMVRTLMENDKFDFTKAECSFELQTLLMNWIGLIPEAQELFFMIKSSIADTTTSDSEDEEKSNNHTITRSQIQDGDLFVDDSEDGEDGGSEVASKNEANEYSDKLISLLPPVAPGDKENPAISTLRTFMKKHSFMKDVPVSGRKVIHKGNEIFPLKNYEKPISLRDYIGSYDYKANKE